MQIWSILSGLKKSWVAQTWKDTFCFRSDEDFMFIRMNNLDLKCPLSSAFSGWAEDSSSLRIFHPCYIQRNGNTENVNRKKIKSSQEHWLPSWGLLFVSFWPITLFRNVSGILWRLSVKPGRSFHLQPVENIFALLVNDLWTPLSDAALRLCISQLMAPCHQPSNCRGSGAPLALVKFEFILFLLPALSPCKFMTC